MLVSNGYNTIDKSYAGDWDIKDYSVNGCGANDNKGILKCGVFIFEDDSDLLIEAVNYISSIGFKREGLVG